MSIAIPTYSSHTVSCTNFSFLLAHIIRSTCRILYPILLDHLVDILEMTGDQELEMENKKSDLGERSDFLGRKGIVDIKKPEFIFYE